MKKAKKYLGILCGAVIMCSILVPSCAVTERTEETPRETEDKIATEEIQPRWEECTEYTDGKVDKTKTVYTGWIRVRTTPCIHGGEEHGDLDHREERKRIETYQCVNCKQGYDKTYTEARVWCEFFNDYVNAID